MLSFEQCVDVFVPIERADKGLKSLSKGRQDNPHYRARIMNATANIGVSQEAYPAIVFGVFIWAGPLVLARSPVRSDVPVLRFGARPADGGPGSTPHGARRGCRGTERGVSAKRTGTTLRRIGDGAIRSTRVIGCGHPTSASRLCNRLDVATRSSRARGNLRDGVADDAAMTC